MCRTAPRQTGNGQFRREWYFLVAAGSLLLGPTGCTGARPAPQVVPAHSTRIPSTPAGVEDWVYPEALRKSQDVDRASPTPKRGGTRPEQPAARPGHPRPAGTTEPRRFQGRPTPGVPVLPWAWVPKSPSGDTAQPTQPGRAPVREDKPLSFPATTRPLPPPNREPAEVKAVPVEPAPGEGLAPIRIRPLPAQRKPSDSRPRPKTSPVEGPASASPPEQRSEQPRSRETLPTPPTQTPPAIGDTVYVTTSGKKYHHMGCRYLRKSATGMGIEAARAKGCTPCSRCFP